jgi:hypothetical protein
MNGVVDDLLKELRNKQLARLPWEDFWASAANYVLSSTERFDTGISGSRTSTLAVDAVVGSPLAAERSRTVYDQTPQAALSRLTSAIMSFTTPKGQDYWHGLGKTGALSTPETDEEKRWLERVRNYQFTTRDNPASGFWPSHKAALRATVAFGNGVVFTSERVSTETPVLYQFVPLSENHLGTNFRGEYTENFRLFRKTAAQCVQQWGDRCSEKVRKWANDPKDKDKPILLLHAVKPREEAGSSRAGVRRNTASASYYVEVDHKHLIGDSGFYEFPYLVYAWERDGVSPYSEGPMALALADVKSLNMLSKTTLKAAAKAVGPPMAVPWDMNRLNLNPEAMNVGYMDNQGRLLAQPLMTIQNPAFAENLLETKREQVRRVLYMDLWQTAVDNPNMTAYEVFARMQEKGEILGPAGDSLLTTMAVMVDRELAIYERLGAFTPDGALAAPKSIQGESVGAKFTSPLNRMRRANQVVAMERLFIQAGQMAQATGDMGIMDKLDTDAVLDEMQEILGAPRRVIRSDDEIQQLRAQRQQMMAAQQAIAGVQGAGAAAQDAAAGLDAIANSPAAAAALSSLGG